MRERLWKMAMVALMALFLSTVTARAEAPTYSGGSGTPDDPYLIANLADLRHLSEYPDHWELHFRQTVNIDATGTLDWDGGAGWSPIGNQKQCRRPRGISSKYQLHRQQLQHGRRIRAKFCGRYRGGPL